MMIQSVLGAVSACVLTLSTLSAEAALVSRLGGQAYYDDQLGITWTANADINGLDTWDNQVAWAAGLNIDGVTGWRLASMDVNGDGGVVSCAYDQVDCMDNEYGHLFNYGAGTVYGNGISVSNPGPFSNIQSGFSWSGTDLGPSSATASAFTFFSGGQVSELTKSFNFSAWAVHEGDVGASTVPVPAAVWLFGSSLLGLAGVAWRRTA